MKKRHIVFQLNNDLVAIDVEDIQEIVQLDTMVKTKKDDLNVMYWQSKSIPVVDPIAMLTLSNHVPTIKSRIAVVKKRGKDFGVLMDAVIGILEVEENEINEPMLNEPRYVAGVLENQIKIFESDAFLTNRMLESFDAVYQLEIYHLEEAAKIHGKKAQGNEDVIENVRLRALNWLVKATKKNIEESFISEAIKIHDLITKLK